MILGNRDFRLDPVFYFPISTNDMYMHPGFFSVVIDTVGGAIYDDEA